MKKLTLFIGLIIIIQSCGPTKEHIDSYNINYSKDLSTNIEGNNSNVKITTAIHEGRHYIVATYREGVCIIPRN